MLAWLSFWSEVQTCIWPSWCHYHSLSLASVKSRLVLPSWYRLTWVVPDKRAVKQVRVCLLYLGTETCLQGFCCVMSYWPTTSQPCQGRLNVLGAPEPTRLMGRPWDRGFSGWAPQSFLSANVQLFPIRVRRRIANKVAFVKIIFDILGVSLDWGGGRNAAKIGLNCQNLSTCTETDLSCYLASENYAVGFTYVTWWKNNAWAIRWPPGDWWPVG